MEDCIIIKPRRFERTIWIVMNALVAIFYIILMIARDAVAFGINYGVILLIILCGIFLDLKTLTISKSGICAKFGLYKKHYKWSDFKCICLQNYMGKGSAEWTDEAIVFSTKQSEIPVQRSHKTQSFLHPFSFLYISFCSEEKANNVFRPYGIISYVADKDEVLSKLAEWGIEVERC